ncbi:uncharacterized protein BT62DRAFT_930705 [Guyanagaster necrorhizus]|uniref:Uncharacterized protein n=1 Tax=Guyanagaster necrorhizus TaxID=856835 RepID=A0A9P8ATQ6_9AGAR|nr:uncharacterized protein BT62DRAFT_930705 [Guyanagaster necrorhizus MCA 3950]KAG7447678.1 hypothetical protein BT62DRAFT_930705 [Guyanagaster necrorhizus MCA 3950]
MRPIFTCLLVLCASLTAQAVAISCGSFPRQLSRHGPLTRHHRCDQLHNARTRDMRRK